MLQKQTEIINVEAQNRNTEKRLNAEAEANALLAVARAEAEALIIGAEAQKQALILQGTGEAERARMLNETPLGAQLASLELQKDTLSGINQVLYVPHIPSMFKEGNGIFVDQSTILPHQN
jgi:regulator of protease activity HflC (stomatin/prohibitin superfamily)